MTLESSTEISNLMTKLERESNHNDNFKTYK